MTDVAVQIVTHNSVHFLDPMLTALMSQVGDWTVQVIDNASSDDTYSFIKKWNIPIYRNSQNLGYAAAHNQALTMSDSKYVLTLNPDVLLQPNFIISMVETLNQYPMVGMATGCLQRVDELGSDPYEIDGNGIYLLRNGRQGLIGEGLKLGKQPNKLAYVFGADGAAAFYRREMLYDIRLESDVFDEDYFLHKEDVDICWRAQWRGWQALYVPDAIAHHVRTFRPGKRHNVNERLRYYGLRNRYSVMLKNQDVKHFWVDFLHILVYELQIWIYVFMFERYSLRLPIELAQNRKRWMVKRKRIRQARRIKPAEIRQWFYHKAIVLED